MAHTDGHTKSQSQRRIVNKIHNRMIRREVRQLVSTGKYELLSTTGPMMPRIPNSRRCYFCNTPFWFCCC